MTSGIRLRIVYEGAGPVHWSRDPRGFGIQDTEAVLHQGVATRDGAIVFDVMLGVKAGKAGEPVFTGDFAHGKPAERFVYLGWRDAAGAFAQRLKLPLAGITWEQVREAQAKNVPVAGTLVDHHPRTTTTGANIGGTRAMTWTVADAGAI